MDWGTIGASVLGSGIVGGSVSYLVANRESKDRQAALQLERDKWDHEKGAEHRQRSTKVIMKALEALESFRSALEQLEEDIADPNNPLDSLETIVTLVDTSTPLSMHLNFAGFEEAASQFDTTFIAGSDRVDLLTKRGDRPHASEPEEGDFEMAYLKALQLLHRDLKAL